ncbi:hypothetical protein K502DRAFT_346018 [Neoconidiobolus thromboides FSU 785]|nr:hypothetical protein K502DRAFT_346018 [Neoconidiobolus thromboides FSU 785]
MEISSKRRAGSRVDVIKSKLDSIDSSINNIFKQLDSHSNLEFRQKVYEYLNWAQNEFRIINQEKYSNDEILKKIFYYKLLLDGNFEAVTTFSHPPNETIIKNIDSITVYQTYSHFLEQGSIFFVKNIYPYKLWFEKFNSKAILANKEPTTLSYTLIVLFARFTVIHGSIAYKQIYKKSLKGIKAILPQSYFNPSYGQGIALGLLSYISLSHSNFDLAKQYLLGAIRMVQSLSYNINDSSFNELDILDMRYNELSRGRRIWKTLYLNHLTLSYYTADMYFIKFEIKEPLYFFRKNHNKNNTNSKRIRCETVDKDPYLFIKDLIGVNIKIATHIQNVKEKYELSNNYSNIPTDDLVLPQSEEESDYSETELKERANDHNFNFKRYIKVLIQHSIMTLYYPSVMIYPQPVRFIGPTLKLLFNHANQVITYCLNKSLNKNLNHETLMFSKIHQFDTKYKLQANIRVPFYYQAYFSFFTLLNLSHQTSSLRDDDMFMVNEAQAKCVLLIKELYIISKSDNKRHSKDSTNALDQIKCCIHRFQLHPDLIEEISIYLN